MDMTGYNEISKKVQRRSTSICSKSRTLICLSGIVLMCVVSYFSRSGYNLRLQILETQIENLHAVIDERVNEGFERAKRSVDNANNQGSQLPEPALPPHNPGAGGAMYTRWGRKDCPYESGSHLVYKGVAAGSHYNHYGGGPNLICIHENITYTPGKFVNGFQGSSYIYGVEYQDAAWADPLFDLSLIENSNFRMHAVPCATCIASQRQNQIMIPGREECPSGFTFEYKGFVASSAHGHKHSTNYICLDEKPQVVPGSGGSQPGDYLYIVETSCPSLPCDPIVNGRELRCVVCSI